MTLFGKVTIIKSLIVPQLTYLLSVLPNPGQNYLKDIDSLIFNFLWDNKPPKIKREVILQKANQGGLNITDIYTYSKSVKFQWVKKLLDSSFESSWKDIIKLRYHIFNQNFIFNCDLNTSDIDNITMKDIFWTDLLKFFFELKTKEKIPLNVDSIIWYNSSLKIEGKTLFYKELFDNNIIFIKDILDEENKFKTYDELKNQLNCKLNFLKYFSLISMIKSKNVTNITNAEYRSHLINTILNSKSLSKEIYNKLSPLENLEVDSIKGISKWKSDMETDINISDVFRNLYLVTNDSKLKNFQYKLLHRTLPTNTFLVKIGIIIL